MLKISQFMDLVGIYPLANRILEEISNDSARKRIIASLRFAGLYPAALAIEHGDKTHMDRVVDWLRGISAGHLLPTMPLCPREDLEPYFVTPGRVVDDILAGQSLSDSRALDAAAKGYRIEFQRAVLRLIRNPESRKAAAEARKALAAISNRPVNGNDGPFMLAAIALFDVIAKSGANDESIKLVPRIDLALRSMGEGRQQDHAQVLSRILHILARAPSVSKRVEMVKSRYGIEELLKKEWSGGPGSAAQWIDPEGAKDCAKMLRSIASIIADGVPALNVTAASLCSNARGKMRSESEKRAMEIFGRLFHAGESQWKEIAVHASRACEFLIGYLDVAAMGAEPPSGWVNDAIVSLQTAGESSKSFEVDTIEGDFDPAHFASNLPVDEVVDQEMVSIFYEDCDSVCDEVARLLAGDANESQILGLRRAFHTLKGGAYMNGMTNLGDAMAAAESVFSVNGVKSVGPDLTAAVIGWSDLAKAAVHSAMRTRLAFVNRDKVIKEAAEWARPTAAEGAFPKLELLPND